MIPAISGAVGPLGAREWTIAPISQIDPTGQAAGAAATSDTGAANGNGSFGGILTNAINSLEQTQSTASAASQALATGQLSDPTQAVTAVENASLEMQFASQLRNSVDTDATTIFQTQV